MKLGKYITQIRGVSYKPSDVTTIENGLPILRANNINNDEMNFEDLIYINPSKIKDNHLLKIGDILVCASSGSKSLVGKACIYKPYDTNIAFGAFCKVIRIKDSNNINADFIRLFFKSNFYRKQISELSKGANINNIKSEDINNLDINIPAIEVQNKVVLILNNLIRALNNKKAEFLLFDEIIKSRFIEMFGNPLSNEYTTPFSQACVFNPKKTEKKDWTDDLLVSFVSMPLVSEHGEIQTNNIKPYSEVKKGFTYFRENDVLFAKITPCMENGKGAIAVNLQNGIGFGSTEFHVFRPIENISNPYWIYYFMAIDSFRIMAEKKMTGSAGQKRVPISFFENLKVNLPPISLQNEFAEFVKLIDKSKFDDYSRYFLCDILTLTSSTIAYSKVVSILEWPNKCCTCSIGIPLSMAFVANVLLNLCG